MVCIEVLLLCNTGDQPINTAHAILGKHSELLWFCVLIAILEQRDISLMGRFEIKILNIYLIISQQ